MSQRAEILRLLSGKKTNSTPAFSGLIHVTAEGLQSEGLAFHEVHKDSRKMANTSASTFKLSGLPSAVAPLDMYVEAEAFGARIDFRENREFVFPQVTAPLFATTKDLNRDDFESRDLVTKGRIPIVCEAIRYLKEDIGQEAIIGGMIPGPYTLLLFLMEPGGLFVEMKREPGLVADALFYLSSCLAQVGIAYRNAGADFITIHDMGGSPLSDPPSMSSLPIGRKLLIAERRRAVLSIPEHEQVHGLLPEQARCNSVDD
jgi:[methyl-Co(III) methanol-specific corrinoid protein]:coenzyme M methyltransferase